MKQVLEQALLNLILKSTLYKLLKLTNLDFITLTQVNKNLTIFIVKHKNHKNQKIPKKYNCLIIV